MYKQLYAIKNKTLAGGGYTIKFYAIVLTYEYIFMCTYVTPMTKTHD